MSLVIDPRYCGPPESANGGYFAGILARRLPGAVEVTLRLPPPLSSPMTLAPHDGGLDVRDGDRLVAQARTSNADLASGVPRPVSLERAEHAAQSFIYAAAGHPFPTCFVCGTQRGPGDGLRLFPGPAGDGVACAWTPHESLADARGAVRPEFLWSALDCPSYFGAIAAGYAEPAAAVLGRITAQVWQRPDAGEPLVVQAWGVSSDGRRSVAGSAVFTADGEVCAAARAVWFRLG